MKHQIDFLELLQIDYEKYPVIAVVGGGGKTSLIYRLTDELIDKGKRVIITTTTHMAGESELPFARGGDAVRVKELLDKERYVIAAEYEEDTGKYASLTEEKLEELRELCDVMLVEADGAKHHPVKVPEKWEPVIPRCADIVISVIGLDCLGQPISQSAYRMERTSEFLRKSLEAPITEEDIVKIETYSLKLKSMMNTIKKGERWDETKIVQEEQDIKELISKALSSNEPFNAL